MEVVIFPCRQDNYGYLLHNEDHNLTAAIDTPSATAVLRELAQRGWQLDYILNTHHHHDHTGGNLELQQQTNCTICGPAGDIPGRNQVLRHGSQFALGASVATVVGTPGHTIEHIVYVFPDILFAGDTIFSMGCGRLFEGSPEQMWQSLQKLAQLPADTLLYCAHEYTETNARFALSVEPGNTSLQQRYAEVKELRAANKPTLPVSMEIEKKTNPFMRPHSSEIRANLGMEDASDLQVFTELRRRKDSFN